MTSSTGSTTGSTTSAPPPPPPGGPPPKKVVVQRVERSEAEQAAVEERLRQAGLAALGGAGASWGDRITQINSWWSRMKEREATEDWATVFAADRMCVRGINTSSSAGGGWVVARNAANLNEQVPVLLWRDCESVKARMEPANFLHAAGAKSRKDELGLHALSTCLLDHTKTISAQSKPYEIAIQVFMPVPSETDMQIFSAVSGLRDANVHRLIEMRSQMTRIEGAAAEDMHTGFAFVRSGTGSPSFRYGITGVHGAPPVFASPIEIRGRRTNALEHRRLLGEGVINAVGEVVVSYRQCANRFFPLFTEWDATNGRYWIGEPVPTAAYKEWWAREIKKDGSDVSKMEGVPKTHELKRTGGYITDAGQYVPK